MAIQQLAAVAVDIGSSYIKLVHTNKRGKILNCAVEKLPEGCIKGLEIQAEQPIIKTLKKARKKNNIPAGRCILVLSGNEVITRHFKLPKLPEDQLYKNIVYEMSAYLPVDAERYSIDYKIVGTVNDGKSEMYNVMVTTVDKRILARFNRIMKSAGLPPKIIDNTENSKEKLILLNRQQKSRPSLDDGICIIDFGSNLTKINIFHKGRFCVGNTLRRGGDTITNIITNSIGVDILTAESLKANTDFFFSKIEKNDIRIAITKEVDTIISEISRVLNYYRTKVNSDGIKSIYIVGGSSMLKRLPEYIGNQLDIKILKSHELIQDYRQLHPKISENFPYILSAYAATLREE